MNTREQFREWLGLQLILRDGACNLVDVIAENIPDNPNLIERGRAVQVPRMDSYVGMDAALERESVWIDEALDYLLANRPLMLEGAVA